MSKQIKIQVCITPEIKEKVDAALAKDSTYRSASHIGAIGIEQLLCEHHISGNKCLKCGRRF